MTHVLTLVDAEKRAYRITAPNVLSSEDFDAALSDLCSRPITARKVACVVARCVVQHEVVNTIWNGKETSNIGEAGDWVVTNLSRDGAVLRDMVGNANVYVVRGKKFEELYELAQKTGEAAVYRARGMVEAIYFEGGYDIMAPWGERQEAARG